MFIFTCLKTYLCITINLRDIKKKSKKLEVKMEVYESIIVKVIVMLDEVEYDIIYNQKDKDLIYEDLSNIIKIAIDTKDFF